MRILAALLASTTTLVCQASFTPFGTGCPYMSQTPAIGNVGLPQIGQTFSITYSGPNHTYNSAQQIAQPHLALGFQSVVTVIPANILVYQPAGCLGYLLPIAMIPMPVHPTLPAYENSWRMSIPNDPGLIGLQFLAQWLLVAQQCGFAGCGLSAAVTSDAATIQIGP